MDTVYLEYRYEYDERAIKEGRKEVAISATSRPCAADSNLNSGAAPRRAMADVNLTAPDSPPSSCRTPTPPAREAHGTCSGWFIFALFALFVGIVARILLVQLDPQYEAGKAMLPQPFHRAGTGPHPRRKAISWPPACGSTCIGIHVSTRSRKRTSSTPISTLASLRRIRQAQHRKDGETSCSPPAERAPAATWPSPQHQMGPPPNRVLPLD